MAPAALRLRHHDDPDQGLHDRAPPVQVERQGPVGIATIGRALVFQRRLLGLQRVHLREDARAGKHAVVNRGYGFLDLHRDLAAPASPSHSGAGS
jgi:hypothetical protein